MASTPKINMSKICRICMANVNLQLIFKFHNEFDNETIDLSHKLKVCCNFDVNLEDKMPKHICKSCCDTLTAAYDLVMLCKETEDTLRKYIEIEETNESLKYLEESDYCDVEYLSDSDHDGETDYVHDKQLNVVEYLSDSDHDGESDYVHGKQLNVGIYSENTDSNNIESGNEKSTLKNRNDGFVYNIMLQEKKENLQQGNIKIGNIIENLVSNNSIRIVSLKKVTEPLVPQDSQNNKIKCQSNPTLNNCQEIGFEPQINCQNTVIKPIRLLASHGSQNISTKPDISLASADGKEMIQQNNPDSQATQIDAMKPQRYLTSFDSREKPIKLAESGVSPKILKKLPDGVKPPDNGKIVKIQKRYLMCLDAQKNRLISCDPINVNSKTPIKKINQSGISRKNGNIFAVPRKVRTDKNMESSDSEECEDDNDDEENYEGVYIPPKKKREVRDDWLCEKCAYYNTNRALFQQHVLTHQPKTIKQCSRCPYKTTYQGLFVEHMRYRHLGVPLRQCDKCPYTAHNRFAFHEHMMRHSGEKRYSCALCNYRTYNTGNLKIHMLKHTNERKFKCDQCNADYKLKRDLKLHIMRVHQNIKKYRCKPCRLTYIGEEPYERHMRKHTENKITKKPPIVRKRYKFKTTKDNMKDNDKSKGTDKDVDVS